MLKEKDDMAAERDGAVETANVAVKDKEVCCVCSEACVFKPLALFSSASGAGHGARLAPCPDPSPPHSSPFRDYRAPTPIPTRKPSPLRRRRLLICRKWSSKWLAQLSS